MSEAVHVNVFSSNISVSVNLLKHVSWLCYKNSGDSFWPAAVAVAVVCMRCFVEVPLFFDIAAFRWVLQPVSLQVAWVLHHVLNSSLNCSQ